MAKQVITASDPWGRVFLTSGRVRQLEGQNEAIDVKLATLDKQGAKQERAVESAHKRVGGEGISAALDGREPKYDPADLDLIRNAPHTATAAAGARDQIWAQREALQAALREAKAEQVAAISALSRALQAKAKAAAQDALKAVAPHLADLLGIEAVYKEHCNGKPLKLQLCPADEPPWDSEFVVSNFVNKLPVQLRVRELDISELHKSALPIAGEINSKLAQHHEVIG